MLIRFKREELSNTHISKQARENSQTLRVLALGWNLWKSSGLEKFRINACSNKKKRHKEIFKVCVFLLILFSSCDSVLLTEFSFVALLGISLDLFGTICGSYLLNIALEHQGLHCHSLRLPQHIVVLASHKEMVFYRSYAFGGLNKHFCSLSSGAISTTFSFCFQIMKWGSERWGMPFDHGFEL